MTWWGNQRSYFFCCFFLSCHTTTIFIQLGAAYKLCVWRPEYVLICALGLSEGPTVEAPPLTPVKREGCPLPAALRRARPVPGRWGLSNLLFVPLLLRKYFLNSSFSFVYLYCSYFLPRFNPVPVLFICFLNTAAVHHGQPATKETLKNDFCPRRGHCLFVRANLKGDKVFLGGIPTRRWQLSWVMHADPPPDRRDPRGP